MGLVSNNRDSPCYRIFLRNKNYIYRLTIVRARDGDILEDLFFESNSCFFFREGLLGIGANHKTTG